MAQLPSARPRCPVCRGFVRGGQPCPRCAAHQAKAGAETRLFSAASDDIERRYPVVAKPER